VVSNLSCIGLGADSGQALHELVTRVLPKSVSLGVKDGVDVRRWEDPSGARLLLGERDGKVRELLPSFAGTPSARLADVAALTPEIVAADVIEDGEMVSRMAFELEERRFLDPTPPRPEGEVSIVAFGRSVALYADEDAFAQSPDSLVGGGDTAAEEPPPHFVERGWKWPPRMAAESFISTGLFGSPTAEARLYGTVRSAERRIVSETGNEIDVLVVHTVGFDATVCVPARMLGVEPLPGNVLGGSVYLVVSMPSILPGGAGRSPAVARRRFRRTR
jgi:hypothetical protein